MIVRYIVHYYEYSKYYKDPSINQRTFQDLADVREFVQNVPDNIEIKKIEKRTTEEIKYEDLF